MTIEELIDQSWTTANEKGWHSQPRQLPEILMLIVSELAEALEEYRIGRPPNEVLTDSTGKLHGIPIELADAIIRIADAAKELNINLPAALNAKLAYNKSRPYRHGNKTA